MLADNAVWKNAFHSPCVLLLSDIQALILEPCISRLIDVIQAQLVTFAELVRKDVIYVCS